MNGLHLEKRKKISLLQSQPTQHITKDHIVSTKIFNEEFFFQNFYIAENFRLADP